MQKVNLIQEKHVGDVRKGSYDKKHAVEGMSCAVCSESFERVTRRIKGVTLADVDLLAKTLICNFDDSIVGDSDIIAAVEKGS